MEPHILAIKAMEEHGFIVGSVVMDGKIHRFDVEDKKLAGWYCFYGDGIPAGSYGNWATGEKHRWCEKGESELDPQERAGYLRKLEQIKRRREVIQAQEHAIAAEKVNNIYRTLHDADDHPYLTKKQIKPYFAKQGEDGSLVIPVYSDDDRIQSLQLISPTRSKLFYPGGRMKGGFLPIGNGVYDPVLICEGYATGCTLFDATGHDTYISFTAGNLKAVAKIVKKRHPDAKIIVCCDNDAGTEGNPGITKGKEAAESIGAYYAWPAFETKHYETMKPTDFNDLYILTGNHEVRAQVYDYNPKPATENKPAPKPKINLDNVYTSDRMFETYLQYIRTLKDNRFLTGINEIDQKIRGVSGGEVLTIIARAGSFKTAMLQNMLLRYAQHSAWAAVFFSLEMPVSSVTERYMGIIMEFEGREAENIFMEHVKSGKHTEYISEIRKAFNEKMNRVFIVPVKVSLQDMGEYVKLIEKEHKVKVGVIGIDYMGLIDCKGKDEYETISTIARGAKELSKELLLPTVILCQTSRAGGDGDEEISLSMGRGSGAIEEGADFVLGLWQSEVKDHTGKPTGSNELICRILKNRKGPKGSRWRLDIKQETLTFGENATEYVPVETKKNSKKRP